MDDVVTIATDSNLGNPQRNLLGLQVTPHNCCTKQGANVLPQDLIGHILYLSDRQLAVQTGFVFYAPRAGAARHACRAGAWPFWVVRRYSESEELGSL